MSTIFIRQDTDDRTGFVKAFFEQSEIKMHVAQAKSILVKPNLVGMLPSPETTHSDVLKETLRILKGKNLVVGDGPPPGFLIPKRRRNVMKHELADVCAEAGLELLNLHHHGFTKVRTNSGWKVRVSKLAKEQDLLISLPVAKVHTICGITGALKNNFGLTPSLSRIFHHVPSPRVWNIHRTIAELNSVFKPVIYLIDAVCSYRGGHQKHLGGIPCHPRTIFGGTDPVALDTLVLSILQNFEPKLQGKKPQDIKHLNWAIKIGLGETASNKIPI